ncbi:MAG: endonuclease III [Anaerolineae bacterium]|nr:endonuclease III [Anaerolineae bacterium]
MSRPSENTVPMPVSEYPSRKALSIHKRLVSEYGPRLSRAHTLDPLSELIFTILSQNTSDVNRDRAYETLRSRFPAWEQVRLASVEEIEDAIRIGGLAAIKAPRIKSILEHIHREQGTLSLDFLREMPVPEARKWLVSLKGVGHKTASCVLLFSLDRSALPVDTHVHRVTRRLGLVPMKSSAERTNILLEAMVPQELYYPFHVNIIAHGRQVCHAQRPKCYACVLEDLCDFVDKSLEPPQ